MIIRSAKYIGSYTNGAQCPPEDKPEYVFTGRSNVGKSSFINMLTGFSKLAKISVTPGKTRNINYFLVNGKWYLIDLPGYGYAKISQKMRANWERMMSVYLQKRQTIQCVFLLVDSRIPPQKSDIEFANWLGEKEIPLMVIFTKADKQGSMQTSIKIEAFKQELLKTWETLPESFVTSSKTKLGREEVLKFIDGLNKSFKKLPDPEGAKGSE